LGGEAKGVALVMVLWVVAILSVVVLEFCFAMRTEVNITKNFKEETQLYAIAEGGIERAVVELVYKRDARLQQLRKTLKPEEAPSGEKEQNEWMTDGRPYLVSFGQGDCKVRIIGEAGKVNVNTVSDQTLRKIVGQLGLEGEARDIVVDSILDWRTPGDLQRLNGAKDDYYQSLKDPYFCKNGKLDSIEELLLVRGVTPELFYGRRRGEGGEKEEKVGLQDIFSVYASGEQIDINSATLLVLRFALGIPNELAQSLVKARGEKGFQNQQELLQRVPELSPLMGDVGRFIVFQSTTPYFTIESRATNKEGSSIRGVKAIVKIDRTEEKGYKMIQWVDALL
jgi:general secretion pathway protein K